MLTLTSKSGRIITLRPPQSGDESALFQYATALQKEDTFVLLNPDLPVTWTEETDYLNSCLKKIAANWLIYFLAFHDNQLIGSSQVAVGGRRKMHLGSFGISLLPAFRGDGLGFQLAQLTINEAKHKMNLSLITLEVFALNEVALKLYQKLGFLEYGRLPNGLKYQGKFIDAILMSKKL